ncbi:hypothetical protein NHX12_030828, partial [Muraenolepis orangiensis]
SSGGAARQRKSCSSAISMDCISMDCISMDCISVDCITMDCISMDCISVDCISMDCITMDCISMDCISMDSDSRDSSEPCSKNIITHRVSDPSGSFHSPLDRTVPVPVLSSVPFSGKGVFIREEEAALANEFHWQSLACLGSSRVYHTVTEVGGQMYMLGGCNSAGRPCATVDLYSPEGDRWISLL